MQLLNLSRCEGGSLMVMKHHSQTLGCDMQFALFLPPRDEHKPTHSLLFLAGLTSTWENAPTKAGAMKHAAELGMALIFPDTSPRGEGVHDESDNIGLGWGAGFYLTATRQPWAKNYRMDQYIVDELLPEIADKYPSIHATRCAISGFSMGGLGALSLGLRFPERFVSISAFAPICSLYHSNWGQDAVKNYFNDPEEARQFDPCSLIEAQGYAKPLLIDQGAEDEFLQWGLKTEHLQRACEIRKVSLHLRMQPGYDHSYYFVSTFIHDHLDFAYDQLRQEPA